MKLHGKATLTIKDSKTGEIKHRESHSNTITPAIASIMSSNLSGTLSYGDIMPLVSKLLGGACLFNGTVDPADIFLPKAEDATLTAHAGQNQTFDAAADPKRGIINTALSGPISNGYKWTWQWTTTGNGTITDVALTHADTGDFWNESVPNMMAANFEPVEDVCLHNLDATIFGYSGAYGLPGDHLENAKKIPIGFLDDVNGVVTIEVDEDNMRFNVYVAKFPGKGAWIWNELGEPYDEYMIPFPVSHPQWGYFENLGYFMYMLAFDKENKKIYAFTNGSQRGDGSWINKSKDFSYDVLDLSLGTVTSGTCDCTSILGPATDPDTPFLCFISTFSAGNPILTQIVDGSVFLPTDQSKVLRVNLSNMSDQELIDDLYVTVGNDQTNNGAVNLGNDRICLLNTYGYKKADGTYAGLPIKREDAVRTVFGPQDKNVRVFAAEQPTPSPIQFMTRSYYGFPDDPPRGAILNKLYMATVFHLENSVTKSASQTMTLEYTLTQEEES